MTHSYPTIGQLLCSTMLIGEAYEPLLHACLSEGRRFQIAKFTHNWTPTLDQRAIQDNSIDR